MSSTTLSVQINLAGKELFSAADAPGGSTDFDRTLSTGGQGLRTTYNATSLPKVDGSIAARSITLSGAATLDFTALLGLAIPGSATRTLDFTGKRLKWFLLRTPIANNAAGITIAPGAANPYHLFGAAKPIILGPGRILASGFDGIESNLPIVAGGATNIDLTPGAANDVLYVEFHFGTTP